MMKLEQKVRINSEMTHPQQCNY